MPVRTFDIHGPLDLRRTLGPLSRGPGDPTMRLSGARAWRAMRTPAGPATITLAHRDGTIDAEAWGPGAEWALDVVPELLDLGAEPEPIPAGHPLIGELARRYPGIRIPRSGAVLDSLLPAILEQKVIGKEARRAWFGLIRAYGEPAPGPPEWRLRLTPNPAALAGLPYYTYHPFGIEQRRADLIRRVAARAAWFEAIVDLPLPDAYARLRAVPGSAPGPRPRSASGRWAIRTR